MHRGVWEVVAYTEGLGLNQDKRTLQRGNGAEGDGSLDGSWALYRRVTSRR
jgi:hypothetical protein